MFTQINLYSNQNSLKKRSVPLELEIFINNASRLVNPRHHRNYCRICSSVYTFSLTRTTCSWSYENASVEVIVRWGFFDGKSVVAQVIPPAMRAMNELTIHRKTKVATMVCAFWNTLTPKISRTC